VRMPARLAAIFAPAESETHTPSPDHAQFDALNTAALSCDDQVKALWTRAEQLDGMRAAFERIVTRPVAIRELIAAEEARIAAQEERDGTRVDRAALAALRDELTVAEPRAVAAASEMRILANKIQTCKDKINTLHAEARHLLDRRAEAAEQCLQSELDAMAEEFHAARAQYLDMHQRIFAYALAIDEVVGEQPNKVKRWARRNAELLLPVPEGIKDRTSRQAIAAAVEAGAVELLRRFKLHA